jgi:hypothetical protein
MSLRNRARALQKKTGLSYQQALGKLRALAERPAQLAKKTGWPLEVCDRYLTDGHAPIEVIKVAAPADPIEQVCETLRATANARAVVCAALDGRILGHVGRNDLDAVLTGALTGTHRGLETRLPVPPAVAEKWAELPDVWEREGGIVLYSARFKYGMVVVKFQRDETSLGLVKLRTAHAIDQLERLIVDRSTPSVPPVGGTGGSGGLPAEVRVVAPALLEERKKKNS